MAAESDNAAPLRIALLTAADVAPYRTLMLHAYTHAADAFTSTADERAAEPESWWLHRVADPAGFTAAFGAFAGDALVGTVALEFASRSKTRHKALVVGMYVLAAWRGRGVARDLLGAAIAYAQQRGGVSVLQLEVTDGNAAATALYRSLGFEPYGLEPLAVQLAGGLRAKLHMWLALNG